MVIARQARAAATAELLRRFSSLNGEEVCLVACLQKNSGNLTISWFYSGTPPFFKIYKNAKIAMKALSDRLGQDDYFNGNQ
jgi:hypothetical protein